MQGFAPRKAVLLTLTGESVDATNEQNPEAVSVKRRGIGEVGSGLTVELSPHSLSVLEIM